MSWGNLNFFWNILSWFLWDFLRKFLRKKLEIVNFRYEQLILTIRTRPIYNWHILRQKRSFSEWKTSRLIPKSLWLCYFNDINIHYPFKFVPLLRQIWKLLSQINMLESSLLPWIRNFAIRNFSHLGIYHRNRLRWISCKI